jgi:hypothetical protein
VSESHNAVAYIAQNDIPVLLSNSHAINVAETSGVTATPVFTTTDKAYSVIGGQNGEAGVKNLGVVAEKENGATVCWIASGGFLTDSLITYTNGGNFYAFYSAMNYLTGNFTSSLPEIPGVELSETLITTTAIDANIWGTILIFIIPGAVLVGGIVYWLWRRRR